MLIGCCEVRFGSFALKLTAFGAENYWHACVDFSQNQLQGVSKLILIEQIELVKLL